MAKPRIKAETASQLIRKRILHGDHVLTGIPSERTLAHEFGISRETLRRGLKPLEDEGLLVRQPNGRLVVASTQHSAGRRGVLGLVKHSNPSHDHQLWSEAVHGALDGLNCTLRTVTFEHYGDSSIAAGISGFDGLFFLPPAAEIPGWLSSKMRDAECRVVVLDQDATAAKLPSVVMFPPQSERKLLDHLVEFGHHRIDCLNTQAIDRVIQARIDTWSAYIEEKGLAGQLYSLTEFRPITSAYQLVTNRLKEEKTFASALICTTGPAAVGAMRAFYDAGFKLGRDVSVCAVNDEGLGPYLIPSLTCLQTPPRARYLATAVRWMLGGKWEGPLLIQPEDVPMFVGASTGPAHPLGAPVVFATATAKQA